MGDPTKRYIHVVGAVVTRDDLVLCAQRGDHGSLPGLWEFPGGKIESGESKPEALRREIVEELGCSISVGPEITTTTHEYDFGIVVLTTFYCEISHGEPARSEHAELRWMRPSELDSLEWAPADVPAIQIITGDLA